MPQIFNPSVWIEISHFLTPGKQWEIRHVSRCVRDAIEYWWGIDITIPNSELLKSFGARPQQDSNQENVAAFKMEVLLRLYRPCAAFLECRNYVLKMPRWSSRTRESVATQMLKNFNEDKEICIAAVTHWGEAFTKVHENLRTDRDVVLATVAACGDMISSVDKKYRNDPEIVRAAVESNGTAIFYAHGMGCMYPDIGVAAIRSNLCALEHVMFGPGADRWTFRVPPKYMMHNCERIIQLPLEAILIILSRDGELYRNIDMQLQMRKDIALAAVKSTASAYQYLQDHLKYDPDVIDAALNRDPVAIFWIPPTLVTRKMARTAAKTRIGFQSLPMQYMCDLEIVNIAFEADPVSVKSVVKYLCRNRDFLKMVLSECPSFIFEVAEDYDADREIVAFALKRGQYKSSFRPGCTSRIGTTSLVEFVKDDPELMLLLIRGNPEFIRYASERVRSRKEIAVVVASSYYELLNCIGDSIANDPDVVDANFCQDMIHGASTLRNLHLIFTDVGQMSQERRLRNLKKIIGRSRCINWEFIVGHFPESVKLREIMMIAVRYNGHLAKYAEFDTSNDTEFALASVRTSGSALVYQSAENVDPRVVMAAVCQDGTALRYARSNLRSDPAIVTAAVLQNPGAVQYSDPNVWMDTGIVRKILANYEKRQEKRKLAFDKLWRQVMEFEHLGGYRYPFK